jgi:RimJ/RimL family protein N-acetyltransferase
MKELMLRHAFRFVERVVFTVDPNNLRSQMAVEKIGGVRMGTRMNCEGRDSVLFQITMAEFTARFGP